jgi:cation transporter-like permease
VPRIDKSDITEKSAAALVVGLMVVNAIAINVGDSLPHTGTPASLVSYTIIYAVLVGAANAAWAYIAVTKFK